MSTGDHARRSDLFRRVADWMRRRRLDEAGRKLLADVEAELPRTRGRKAGSRVVPVTPDAARRAVEQHGTITAAASALGISRQTLSAILRDD